MALVVDASVLAEFLVGSAVGQRASSTMSLHAGELHVPPLAIVETASVLRAWERRGDITAARASSALEDLAEFPAKRWAAEALLPRVWELRSNVTAYDACYVALAEALGADLLTADRRLARALDGVTSCRVNV